MTDTTDEFLAHFGIKGMKWGVRNAVASSGRVSGGGSRKRFDTLADLHAREVTKHPKFETLSDTRARKTQKQADIAAKIQSRRANSVKRGEEALSTSNAFNSPSLAIGMKALGVVIGGASLALTVRSIVKNPSSGNLNKIKIGMAAAGAIVSGIQVASVARDARDISNYKKSLQPKTAGR